MRVEPFFPCLLLAVLVADMSLEYSSVDCCLVIWLAVITFVDSEIGSRVPASYNLVT